MPLLVNGEKVEWSEQPTRELLDAYPELEERAKLLRSQPVQTVGPKGLLYVQQREFAAATPKDGSVAILGSEDATTCHIVVLRHTGSGATCLTHIDGSDTAKEVLLITNAIKVLSPNAEGGRLELHLVGGFLDERHLSQDLTNLLLHLFHRLQEPIHLVTFCVSELNDREENGNHFPYIYGIGVNVKSGEVFHATFPERGPEELLRSASILTGTKMVNIYDSRKEQLCIGPYKWRPFPHVDFWLEQDDEAILQNLSTSPFAEPPHFVPHVRGTLRFLKEHPSPEKTLFPSKKPWVYRKNSDGLWERVSSDLT